MAAPWRYRKMPFMLMKLAEQLDIHVDFWDFEPPIEGVYYFGKHPYIGLDKSLIGNRAHTRTVLAEEIGHYFTTAGEAIPRPYFHHIDRVLVGKSEYQAAVWAAKYLMPRDKFEKAIKKGIIQPWELAEYFIVDEEIVPLRFKLYYDGE